ncbi:hypothetical protein G6F22_018285 [Rhizopus arrhizus]|nr:hypothetical protein G6F22_018285 [Rhizopus arrhizus]
MGHYFVLTSISICSSVVSTGILGIQPVCILSNSGDDHIRRCSEGRILFGSCRTSATTPACASSISSNDLTVRSRPDPTTYVAPERPADNIAA